MAAILACGEGAVLSHRSAAALYGIGAERKGVIEVSVRRRCTHVRPGLKVRSRRSLPAEDVGTSAGIPVTSPVQTMLDLATALGPRGLERSVNETDGWRYHRTPSAQSRDALRDQTHTATGLTSLRFSHFQVKHDPAHVRNVLTATAAPRRCVSRTYPAKSG
jgi:AbiEi antitoxin C-terminal domain